MLHAVTGSASAGTAAEAAADASKSASGYADAMSDSVSGSANDAATGVQGALRRMGSGALAAGNNVCLLLLSDCSQPL